MGSWTEFKLSVALDREVPRDVLVELGNHNGRWAHVLFGASFMGYAGKLAFDLDHDDSMGFWTLNVVSCIKGMKFNDIREFLAWLSPHVQYTNDFVGYVYFMDWECPHLIMAMGDELELLGVKILGANNE